LKMFSSIVVLVVVQMSRLFGAAQSIGRRVQRFCADTAREGRQAIECDPRVWPANRRALLQADPFVELNDHLISGIICIKQRTTHLNLQVELGFPKSFVVNFGAL
jgi:hypothetical protein